ncbi:MAG TPA: contractile injection system protein, VgrG/Pvc8 family [Polyangia bacterium]|jgi:phage protein D|nr:contractile injection system protein, VgrG/Pvc8 family [Polyangia bacterium]
MASETAEIKVQIGGQPTPIKDVFEILTQADKDQPDMATVTLTNVSGQHSGSVTPGDPLQINAGSTVIFDGDIIGIEPIYDHELPSRVTVRALNRLHRLARGRKSRSFVDTNDQKIVRSICTPVGLSPNFDDASKIPLDQIFQHNQTDLEFIRQRASRLDCEVWVEGKQLYFLKRRTRNDSGLNLEFRKTGGGNLIRFRPRLSTSAQVSKVICRGWDAGKKKEIVGIATPQADLGGKHGAAVAEQQFGAVETLEVGRPIYTQEEADAMANALLKERLMNFITGEAVCHGLPSVKAGSVVNIDVPDSRFKGKYYVAGVSHRYIYPSAESNGASNLERGYKTILRLQRDAES